MDRMRRLSLWAGRICSGLVIAFLTMDAIGKLLRVQPVIDASVALGYRAEDIFLLGVLLAVGIVLYALPRSSVFGAIYITGYLGGALAAHLRIGSPLATHILFAVYVAVFMWLGLVLRSPALARLLTGGSTR